MHQTFHRSAGRPVEMEMPPLPKVLTALGTLEEITYQPEFPSARSGVLWMHEFGDRGSGPRRPGRPLLAADEQGHLWIVPNDDEAHFDAKRGIVG